MNKIFRQTLGLLSVAAALVFSSCDSLTHDETSECPEGMVIQLVPKYAARTSFETEMTDVHINIFNANDVKVSEIEVKADQLARQDYRVSVSIPEGKYHIIAWNGISDTANYATQDDAVTLKTDSDNSTASLLTPLWHGEVAEVNVEALSMKEVQLPMVKDTNSFVVNLCSTTGEILNPDDFEVIVTSENGSLDRNNNVLSGPEITYKSFAQKLVDVEGTLDAELARPDSLGYLHMTHFENNSLRLTTEHKTYLTVNSKVSGKNICVLNLNDYILEACRAENAGANIDSQQYFDTEDSFPITLFLTPRNGSVTDSEGIYYLAVIKVRSWILRNREIYLGE
jgi:hypothetical protein